MKCALGWAFDVFVTRQQEREGFMLDIRTFDAKGGGNVLYKALAHPVAAVALVELAGRLEGPFAVYDPDGNARTLAALYPGFRPACGVYVHDTERVGEDDGFGGRTRALVDLGGSGAKSVLVVSFEDGKMRARLARLGLEMPVETLQDAMLPDDMLSNPRIYLDKLNFATNFALFRDDDRLSTRLVTANYWSNYGAREVRYWLRLYDAGGEVLAQWEERVSREGAGIVIDSAEVRARFGLPPFAGQLFIHVIGARGHDVVKYALDTYGRDGDPSLSVTHDANAWPSDRYATLPAPDAGEQLLLWVQNSHATPISAGAITVNRMGREEHHPVMREVGPFASVAVDVGALVPDVRWPEQLELRAGHHMVRPRYEIVQGGRTRIAHLNVERGDLKPEPAIRNLPKSMGRGFLLPFPVLDPKRFESFVQPTPMSTAIGSLPLRLDVFGAGGVLKASRFLGNLPRDHATVVALHELTDEAGHAELVYDFREGGEADGWLHGLMRYRAREGGHSAETSFGAHIFNTLMTWRSEPQSYAGPPPGLSTRLFLKLGAGGRESFCCLVHPASVEGGPPSRTVLHLHGADGALIGEAALEIAASGSHLVRPRDFFDAGRLGRAGEGGYVLIRDLTCRLFGYHGQEDAAGAFSLDHMFGF